MSKITSRLMALSLGITTICQVARAQDTAMHTPLSFKSVNGHEVLPQKGDFAIGISATSFLNYFGNMFNSNTPNTAPTFNSANAPNAFGIGNLGGVAIMGKYMKRSDLAYRVRFQANAGTVDYRNMVLKNSLTPDPLNPLMAEDKLTVNSYTVLLGAGFEKRRGNGRLQGFYGAEALAGVAGRNTTYTYGNGFDINFNAPVSTTDFSTGSATNSGTRVKEANSGTMLLFGVRGFAGVEYFIAPKISLGGEIGYTLGFSTNGKGKTEIEEWNSTTLSVNRITTHDYQSGGIRSFGIGLDNVNAGINLHFYF